MSRRLVNRLIQQLSAVAPTTTVANPYSSPDQVQNLRAYLLGLIALPFSGHLLVGEAPGHRGCALTGIPFTSQRVLATSSHLFLEQLRPSLSVAGNTTEATASIVWNHLENCDAVPAFWNVFPFHPHKPGNGTSNRAPSGIEVALGRPFVDRVLEILTPTVIVAVGGTAQNAFTRLFPGVDTVMVRHPSYGGKSDFITGITQAGVT
jgi:uracil-DNA glycosylase